MGIWGSGLYDNDSACDVRDGYLDCLQEGLGNEEAYTKTMEQYRDYICDQDEPLFWFALAETQWKVGRLRPEVKTKALEWTEKNGYIDMWEENSKGAAGWEKTLQKLKEKLNSPMPREKKIKKVDLNPWKLQDVYAYKFHKEESKESGFFGKYMLLQKIGEGRYYERKKAFMQIQVIDHVFETLPRLEDINKFRILPLDDLVYIERRKFQTIGIIPMFNASEYPTKYLTFLGTMPGPANSDVTNSIESLNWASYGVLSEPLLSILARERIRDRRGRCLS